MEYRSLGRTGVQVSKLCLGTMMFGAWGNTDHDDSRRIIHAALDAGVNFVDTADAYAAGESDGTEHIDLYQVHRPEPDVDVEETLGALTDLVHQGKVRYIGSSSYSGSQIVEAQWAARGRNLERFRTEQPPYSLLVRSIELDVLPAAQRHGMGILIYSPLSGGWLSGNWTADSSPTSPARQRLAKRFDMSLPENQRKLEAVDELQQVAEDAGLTMIELAIAFVVNHPGVTSAIIGPPRWSSSRASSRAPTRSLTPRRWTASTRSSSPA